MSSPGEFMVRIKNTMKALQAEVATEDEEQDQDNLKRIYLLDELLREERRENRLLNPTIFLSFAGAQGEKMLQDVLPSLRGQKIPGKNKGFLVETGMATRGQPRVMGHIVEKMEPCFLFFGILTCEFRLDQDDGDGGSYAPGAWVLLEAGIAIELGLRVVFFVENGVHRSFWLEPFREWRHARFDPVKYLAGLGLAKEIIVEHYKDLKLRTEG
jgi:hypothetical protein